MATICPICGKVHTYDNIECLRRQQLPDKGEALARIDELERRLNEHALKGSHSHSHSDYWHTPTGIRLRRE